MRTEEEKGERFRIEPAARQFILERGGVIHITMASANLNPAQGPTPLIDIGVPRGARTKYLRFDRDDIAIYLTKALSGVSGPFRITLDTLWRLKKLAVQLTDHPEQQREPYRMRIEKTTKGSTRS
ncbi:hypothetical protein HM1_2818 [Heliomicrobium modesticaldum Ice1]|uniref:Uncharacterized protein n=1 Tax=Heliobacterium modesticaldum (strain ATCC 51547 / Ice1) TaxID=498761 RepID=B0TCF9_HELMI|nr:CC/Se motif family (seleno)protein [Heliomicrobium modesticaldum]ABZ85347.1 hypothetical protein HM1_2818 [Heliomicrobium modesticaldum Ice1]